MLAALLSLAALPDAAASPDHDALREALAPAFPGGHRREPPNFMGVRGGAELLTVSRSGDLVVMQDADGAWMTELIAEGLDVDWALGTVYEAFYDNYEDDYQYLTILLVADLNVFFAFYSPMANDVRGIGYDDIVPGELFDTTDEQVEGMIFMNHYGIWRDNPEQGRYVFGQEFMHRWGSFTNIESNDIDADALLGRDDAHWSFWLDTTNSPMEGNTWVDGGDGTWTTDRDAGSTYSDLDLYLMGLVGPQEVGTQTLLEVAEPGNITAADASIYFADLERRTADVTVAAVPRTFELDAIIAAEGERSPTVAESPKSFRMAFIVLALADDVVDEATLAEIDTLRTTFEADWETDVRGLADLDTTLSGEDAEDAEDTDDAADPADEKPAGGCACATHPATPGAGSAALFAFGALALGLRRRSS